MKAESNIMPFVPFEIEYDGEMCQIRFFENAEELVTDEGVRYVYDEYLLRVRNRFDIEKDIENNLDNWIIIARDAEYEEMMKQIRCKRDKLLVDSDKYLLYDYPISDIEMERVVKYRKELRDITKQQNCPYCVEFPKLTLE